MVYLFERQTVVRGIDRKKEEEQMGRGDSWVHSSNAHSA